MRHGRWETREKEGITQHSTARLTEKRATEDPQTMSAEARALLDALMGSSRNAPVVPPSQSSASSPPNAAGAPAPHLDPSACPLYTAWGVDPYSFFKNTKSSIGSNPRVPRPAAREHYLRSLTAAEQANSGLEANLLYFLQQTIAEGNREVSRRQAKLAREATSSLSSSFVAAASGGPAPTGNPLVDGLLAPEQLSVLADFALDYSTALDSLAGVELELTLALERRLADGKTADDDDDDDDGCDDCDDDPLLLSTDEKVSLLAADAATEILALHDSAKDADAAATRLLGNYSRHSYVLPPSVVDSYACRDRSSPHHSFFPPFPVLHDSMLVCPVTGNYVSLRDDDARIAAHFAGKSYQGWRAIRSKARRLEARGVRAKAMLIGVAKHGAPGGANGNYGMGGRGGYQGGGQQQQQQQQPQYGRGGGGGYGGGGYGGGGYGGGGYGGGGHGGGGGGYGGAGRGSGGGYDNYGRGGGGGNGGQHW